MQARKKTLRMGEKEKRVWGKLELNPKRDIFFAGNGAVCPILRPDKMMTFSQGLFAINLDKL